MFLEYLKAILIGLVEGVTEWLPISSTGHMILVERLFPFTAMSPTFYGLFLYVIQFAAILAVIVLFFSRLNPFSRKKDAEEKRRIFRIWWLIVIGVLPAIVVGLLFDDWVDEHIVASPAGVYVVAGTLILYGVLFILLERTRDKKAPAIPAVHDMTWRQALVVGLFQCLSIVPGTSRSGSTILGGIVLGASREAAAEYSFFMAIPVMAGASVLRTGKFALRAMEGAAGYTCTGTEIGLLIVSSVVAFAVSFVCIRFLLDFVRRHSFEAFGWYRIALGAAVILYFSCFA